MDHILSKDYLLEDFFVSDLLAEKDEFDKIQIMYSNLNE